MEWKGALFWKLLMLHQLMRRLFRSKVQSPQGPLEGPTADAHLLAHPAPDLVLRRKAEDGLGRDSTALPAPRPAALTPILRDLGPDPSLHPRKGWTQNANIDMKLSGLYFVPLH